MAETADPAPLLTRDAAVLLEPLRDGVPRTRAELASLTGLARSTVATRLSALTAAGLVVPAGGAVSSGGRPPACVAFNPAARILLAIDLGATHGVVAVADLSGRILETESSEISIADGPEPVLDWAIRAARTLLERTSRPAADLVGIGIGLPGPVEHSTGMPTNPPIMPGWDRFDVPGYVRPRLGAPVLVDNDVNLLALGEHATAWREHSDLLFVKVATGIGAGIISGGRLQRGAQGSAGDLGHVRVPFTRGNPRHGEPGADLEALASGPAIARALTAAGTEAATSNDVVALERQGSGAAIQAIRQAGRDLGEVLATCVNLLNPSVVVIGGSIARAGEHLLAGVREVVYGQSTPLATQHLAIVPAKAGATGGVLGAAIMVIQNTLDPGAIDAAAGAE
ncbi:ROK family protein [Microbacterium sp. STN6]|uniref:ROK family transcriptional regulator n=1 Tax=Microbacterium sp. STN6 TaxID=2995588 RepID=UPI002260D812|nr:ROK family protein [Microbacterium sp. STN6]MCX7520750.1 ROK family protein [Microbacterium sp. STN6]